MHLIKSIAAAATAIGISASVAAAAIQPRFVIIGPGVPGQPAGVTTYSVVVDLSGISLFNVANMLATLPPGSTFYQAPFGSDTAPNPAIVAVFPETAYDTYVSTTLGFAQAPAIPGRAFEPGPANVGNQPPGDNRTFDVAWGATPNSGPPMGQGLEIARLSVIGGGVPQIDVRSAVFSSDRPNDPVYFVPEPGAAVVGAIAGAFAMLRRRCR
jgi:hypothetical protein